MANAWLVKSEPHDWSWQDQIGVGQEPWNGVKNAQAQKNMRAMAIDDPVFFYHSGKDREIVGLCTVAREPYPDEDDPKGRAVLVDLKTFAPAASPVTLAMIKADGRFDHLALVRQSRLSVMPVDPESFKALLDMTGIKYP